jgi:hypothetical protein
VIEYCVDQQQSTPQSMLALLFSGAGLIACTDLMLPHLFVVLLQLGLVAQ